MNITIFWSSCLLVLYHIVSYYTALRPIVFISWLTYLQTKIFAFQKKIKVFVFFFFISSDVQYSLIYEK